MIQIHQLHMAYGNKLLFYDVNLVLAEHTHYALVGANGAGKSTFFKLITGEEQPVDGVINLPKDASLGWLKQDQFRYEETAIIDIVLRGKPSLWQAMVDKEALFLKEHWDEKTAHELSRLEEVMEAQHGYSAIPLAEKLLLGLGIASAYHRKPLRSLAGGYKLRVLLAQALFQEPDILLLDEPTNHLDIVSVKWLEKYLKTDFRGMVIFISHDIAFIDRLADVILDIDYGEIRPYQGPYEKFLMEKRLLEERKLQDRQAIEQKRAEMQRFIDRFRAGTRARLAQSRMKQLEKIAIPDIQHTSRAYPTFHFKPLKASGKLVLRVQQLKKTLDNQALLANLNFEVLRGERVAILGENGVGKSTLVKILLGKVPFNEGHYEWGAEAQLSYFSQDHHEELNHSIKVLAWLQEATGQAQVQLMRKTLGQVLFKKEDVEKDILALSGGEAARLLLARIVLESANVLVLDEPTNHLDIEAIESLIEALSHYHGTLLFVSHDRYFIEKLATRVFFLSRTRPWIDHKGSFLDFEKRYAELLD